MAGDNVVLLFGEITVNCSLSTPHHPVMLLQEQAGQYVERQPDGVKVLLVKQVFMIKQLDFSDTGRYYCDAPGVEKVLKVNLSMGM